MCLIIIKNLINNIIIMNDSMSILLATTILALGGLGLYMYKSSDDDQTGGNEEYNEDSIFSGNFWGSSDDKEDEEKKEKKDDDDVKSGEPLEDEKIRPRKRIAKTHRNKKMSGSSRRRY